MQKIQINPSTTKHFVDNANILTVNPYPKFINSIKLLPFRHIPFLDINFQHPISVVSGTNRSGKSTILMALACSHFDFKKRNSQNGKLERQTWSSLMKFTNHDNQNQDWTYYITYRFGDKIETKRGQRKHSTKKWNGIGKKESQFVKRQVVFIDLDRITPARHFGQVIYDISKVSSTNAVSQSKVQEIENYISYILEETFTLSNIAHHLDKDIFKYKTNHEYSSFNAASGEEALAKIIIDTVESPSQSLILIDEIEIGLHPKVQRRLIDIIYHISKLEQKQFIITTHSPTILASLPDNSRIFIEKLPDNSFKAIANISVNASLSKMDSQSYPLVDLYCEDIVSEKIIRKSISAIIKEKSLNSFQNLINIIISGSADKTYQHFISHKETYPNRKIKSGYACILDGDMRSVKTEKNLLYPPEECLHFIFSDYAPEKFLLQSYLSTSPNAQLDYHLKNSNPHILFMKMVEFGVCSTKDEAFEICWGEFITTPEGNKYFDELKTFLISMTKKFSPDL